MNTTWRKEDASERREIEDEAITRRLSEHGRKTTAKWLEGNVRTHFWHCRGDLTVPGMIEQIRFYSTSRVVGGTSLMEASDVIHALRGLDKAQRQMNAVQVNWPRPRPLPRELILEAVDRADHPPIVFGNLAALLWETRVNHDVDVIVKVELLAVNAPGVPERVFFASQIGDAKQCFSAANDQIRVIYHRAMTGWKSRRSEAATPTEWTSAQSSRRNWP
jgi:hypothetical protein